MRNEKEYVWGKVSWNDGVDDVAVNGLLDVLVTLWERKYRRCDGERDADSWMRSERI